MADEASIKFAFSSGALAVDPDHGIPQIDEKFEEWMKGYRALNAALAKVPLVIITPRDQAILKAAKTLAHLQDTWPTDGWDGAADARAFHHKKVRDAEKVLQDAYKLTE